MSLWAYEPWKCDGEFCPEDCSHCYKSRIEQDGFITWETEQNETISDAQRSVSELSESAE